LNNISRNCKRLMSVKVRNYQKGRERSSLSRIMKAKNAPLW